MYGTKMVEVDGIEMSDTEKKIIEDFRTKLSADVDQKIYDDTYMLHRFLYACNFNMCNAENMLRKMLLWRKQMRMDSFLNDYKRHEVLRKYVGEPVFASDNRGVPVQYLPVGKLDIKGIISSCKYADIEKFCVHILERDDQNLQKKRETKGGPYPGTIIILDMDGLDFATATDKKGIETVIRILRIHQNFYLDCIDAFYIINASSFFNISFAIIKNFLNAHIVKRIHIFGIDGWKDELLKIIDADKLPAFMGGNRKDPNGDPLCKTIVCQGGKIDQSYYFPKSKKALSTHPDAKKLVLPRASFLEIEEEIKEAGSLIEWEFETKTRDIGFGLFHKEMDGEEEKITELVPLLRLDTESYAETGMYKCEKSGTYIILFDNSYSWIRSKEIYYRTKIISPKDHESQMQ